MRTLAIALALALSLLPSTVTACGMIFPRRIVEPVQIQPPPGPLSPLTVRSTKVKTTIRQGVAETHVDQVFFNETGWQLEGEYLFFLPEGASVDQFALYINGQRVEGELLERDKATGIYEGIVRQMKDPALLEYMGKNVFKARVFPIPARGERRIEIAYKQVVARDFDLSKYVYPIRTPRSIQSRIGSLQIEVSVEAGEPLQALFSPSHKLAVEKPAPNQARLAFSGTDVLTDQDFTLYYSASSKDMGLSLVTYRPDDSEDGYFLLLLTPPAGRDADKALPKDFVFVLDTSGSMAGERIDQARKALRTCVSALDPADRFGLLTFATETRPWSDELVEASDANIKKAGTFIDRIKAVGGTNIDQALRDALKLKPADSKRPFLVCFITDGEPTIGVTDPKQIVENVKKANTDRVRIFTMGVGDELNVHLVDEIASANGGHSEYIKPREDIELKVSQFYRRISSPVLTDLAVDLGKTRVADVYPKKLGDLFLGMQLTVVGRYESFEASAVTLRGRRGEEAVTWSYDARFPEHDTSAPFIPAIWANRKVGYLLDEIRLHGKSPELKDEVIRLAKKFSIVTPYTAYLVVEDEPMQQAAVRRREARDAFRPMPAPSPGSRSRGRAFPMANRAGSPAAAVPLTPGLSRAPGRDLAGKELDEDAFSGSAPAEPAPAGRGGYEGGYHAPPPAMSLEKASGKDAVRMSEALKEMKESATAPAKREAAGSRTIGSRTFVDQDGTWVDTALGDRAVDLTIRYGSEAYFTLITAYPELGKFVALGKNVKLIFKDKVVVISETAGLETTTKADLETAFR